MGERQGWLFEASFNRSIKVRQADPRISSNAGLVLLREADHSLGLTAELGAKLADPRDPNSPRPLGERGSLRPSARRVRFRARSPGKSVAARTACRYDDGRE
jgi:hypothetical protein